MKKRKKKQKTLLKVIRKWMRAKASKPVVQELKLFLARPANCYKDNCQGFYDFN